MPRHGIRISEAHQTLSLLNYPVRLGLADIQQLDFSGADAIIAPWATF